MNVQARTTYRIETFGSLAVAGGTAPLTGAATQRKTLLLLAVLAAAGAQGVGREKLLGLFWPDSDADRARHALKQAIHILRRDLRDPDVIVGTPTLRLNPEVIASDVGEFDDALARGDLERAAALYRGPFLDGLYLDGSPEFERWLERERARLAHAHASAVQKLAVAAGAAGDHARAAAWWRRLAAGDPLSSRIALGLMKALVAAGEPEAALQHARVHEALVRQELEAPPDPAVTALVAQVREGLRARSGAAPVDDVPRPHSPPFAAPAAPPRASGPGGPPQEQSGADRPRDRHPASAPVTLRARGSALRRRVTGAFVVPHRRLGILAGGALLLATATGALVMARPESRPPASAVATPPARSVAVLPFVDMSASAGDSYFGDGLSEELITALSRIDGLHVAARTSSFALRDARLDVRRIGDTLGVANVVEGSVRRDGDRLRITAQLIDARTGYHLWAGEYDREVKDVLAVQDEIAGAIAGALRLTLGGAAGRPAGHAVRREVYDLYLRGNWFRNLLSRDALLKAVEHFDRAIALDSGWAPAYAGKANAMGPLFYFRHVAREPGLTQMRAAARRALALDDGLGEAHVAMGIIHFFYEWDWPAAGREYRRATELNPGDAHAFHHLANYLNAMGQFEAALAARTRSLELDPLNPRTAILLAGDYLRAGQYDRAAEHYRRAADVDSMNPLLLGTGPHLPSGMGEVYEVQGRLDEAVDEYLRVAARRGASEDARRVLRQAYTDGGMPGFWRGWLELERRAAPAGPRAIVVAAIHARTGDAVRAAEWLERAYVERDPGLVYLAVESDWVRVRDDPRVRAIIARMGLRR